ncbi:MAG: hypothetical protein N2423_06520, partial [Novosphingobium sp.]|nr:hypothetical protein [Novosphingobium sp.]
DVGGQDSGPARAGESGRMADDLDDEIPF